jgi:hypothetical protein
VLILLWSITRRAIRRRVQEYQSTRPSRSSHHQQHHPRDQTVAMGSHRGSKSIDGHTNDEKSLRAVSSNRDELPQSTVPIAPEAELSVGNIFKGTAAHSLTTFEKKAALINAELDKFGMGRYQWCIWFLCGFGYFLDLAWSQGVGLFASAVFQEMGVADPDQSTLWACANAGLAIGAFSFGIIVDVIGRRWAFNLTCLITSIFGLILVSLSCESCSILYAETDMSISGCTQEQLRSILRNLLPRVAGTWWQHPHRCHNCSRISAPEPPLSCCSPLAVAADRCRRRFGSRLWNHGQTQVEMRTWAQRLQHWTDTMLHSLEQHWLAFHRNRSGLHDSVCLLPPLLCLYLPGVTQVPDQPRPRSRGHRGSAQNCKVQQSRPAHFDSGASPSS